MRFLLILLFTYFAPLHCSYYRRSNHYFVTRRDNKEATCTEPLDGYHLLPTFDLDNLQIPADVGFKYRDWIGDWKLQNDSDVRRNGFADVFIAGNQPFHFVVREDAKADVYILASNVSLWLADYDRPHGAGMLFEVDHLNETTKLKDTTLKYCDQNSEVEGAKCTIVEYKNGTNFLNDGNHWSRFKIQLKENRTGVEMNEFSYGKVVQCIWNNANISDPFTSDGFKVFAKSHQRNAAFHIYGWHPDLAKYKEMKRNYTKRSSGELCVEVFWNKKISNDSIELMQVKNLVSGRVQAPTNTTQGRYTFFQWNHLDAGEYEITLRYDKGQPWEIDLCQDDYDYSKIWRTWKSMPRAITKCQFEVGYYDEFSAAPSSLPDPTLKPSWTLKEWEHVCDRLGIGSNDTEVQIKYCNLYGCNFSKCPHLHDDPAYIFDF